MGQITGCTGTIGSARDSREIEVDLSRRATAAGCHWDYAAYHPGRAYVFNLLAGVPENHCGQAAPAKPVKFFCLWFFLIHRQSMFMPIHRQSFIVKQWLTYRSVHLVPLGKIGFSFKIHVKIFPAW